MIVSRLLKSWAMPPASRPTASSRWAARSSSSRRERSSMTDHSRSARWTIWGIASRDAGDWMTQSSAPALMARTASRCWSPLMSTIAGKGRSGCARSRSSPLPSGRWALVTRRSGASSSMDRLAAAMELTTTSSGVSPLTRNARRMWATGSGSSWTRRIRRVRSEEITASVGVGTAYRLGSGDLCGPGGCSGPGRAGTSPHERPTDPAADTARRGRERRMLRGEFRLVDVARTRLSRQARAPLRRHGADP